MSLGNNTSVLGKPRSTKHLATRNLSPNGPGLGLFSHNLRNRNTEHSLNFLIRRGWPVSRRCDHLSDLARHLTFASPISIITCHLSAV